MRTHDMINLAEKNGKTYICRYGSYSKSTGFKLNFNPHIKSFEPLINNLFREDCWTIKPEKKRMTKADIENALGYEIEIIDDATAKEKGLSELEQKAYDHLYKYITTTYADLLGD